MVVLKNKSHHFCLNVWYHSKVKKTLLLIKSSNFVQSCSSGRHGMETSLTVTLDDISCTSGSLFLPFQNKTWILFHNFSPFESSVAWTFSRIPRNHFSIFSRFQPSNIEKKITRMTTNTNIQAIVFRISFSTATASIRKLAGNKYVHAAQTHASGYSQQTRILLAHAQ